ncbi:DUF397 domain-containing protein [Saccharopolyspora spinosa]|uniref:Uncharacterized protein DUF397 n=2 Tax=Saccharopolyspora spinosa TaxID=60894 RepID=A0A2N3XTL6_SACSN|nr:DUF397 domain-containing protein [Saccharopolyspora spinosa]PKW14024.1 uncharacterized protein DUF397 [Saccharopolyspora spinosa]
MSPITNWRKSSYSGEESDCVEVGISPDLVGVRDTKDRDGGTLVFGQPTWGRFLAAVKAERFR